jgi:hypothetical protein
MDGIKLVGDDGSARRVDFDDLDGLIDSLVERVDFSRRDRIGNFSLGERFPVSAGQEAAFWSALETTRATIRDPRRAVEQAAERSGVAPALIRAGIEPALLTLAVLQMHDRS